MTTRRQLREAALQVLFGIDLAGGDPSRAIEDYLDQFTVGGLGRDPFFEDIIRGVASRKDELDTIIADISEHWRVDRMSLVDRNIIRMGVYEIVFSREVPARVAINEAVELAKRFGTEESPAFVNGILDRVAQEKSPDARGEP